MSISIYRKTILRPCAGCDETPPPGRRCEQTGAQALASVPFEKLHRALVLLRGGAASERAEVAAPAGARISFAGVEPVAARLELSNHGEFSAGLDRRRYSQFETRLTSASRPLPLQRGAGHRPCRTAWRRLRYRTP